MTDHDWDLVRDLVHVALAAMRLPAGDTNRRFGSVLVFHARNHLRWGTARTLSGWYSADAIERTLATASCTTTHRSLATYAGRLRKVGLLLNPVTVPAGPRVFGGYDPLGPYTTAELTTFLDEADADPRDWARQRFQMLVWLTVGTGVNPAEQQLLSPLCIEATSTALLLHVPGPTARTIPVRHECEHPLIEALADLKPDGSVYQGLEVGDLALTRITERAVRRAGRARVTPLRLRATWLALVLSGPVHLDTVLKAANVRGDKMFGHIARALAPTDPQAAIHALRGASTPLADTAPAPGSATRPPAPHIPLRTVAP